MEIILFILFFVLIAIALIGCFIHRFPGPVLAFAAILMAKLCMKSGELIEWINVIIIGLLVVLCFFLTRQLPKITKKLGEYGKMGNWGALIGSLLALVIIPFCDGLNQYVTLSILLVMMIIFPFIFATLFEFINHKDWGKAMLSARSATLTYVCSTVLKLLTVVYAVYLMFVTPEEVAAKKVEKMIEDNANPIEELYKTSGVDDHINKALEESFKGSGDSYSDDSYSDDYSSTDDYSDNDDYSTDDYSYEDSYDYDNDYNNN